MGKAVVISGTPGVGKSAIAKLLTKKLGGIYVNLTEFVLSNKLYIEYDELRNSYIIDEELVRSKIAGIVKSSEGYVIIDSHYGEIIKDDLVEKIFVLRINPSDLLKRLKSRGWHNTKIRENLEVELLGTCTLNALEEHPAHKICEVDVTNKSQNEVVDEIISILRGKKKCSIGVDWLTNLSDDLIEYIIHSSESS